MPDQMVIFTRAYDFLAWLLERAESFPRSQRFVVTRRLQDAMLDFYETLLEANGRQGKARLDHLRLADIALGKVRHYLRLVTKLGWLSGEQYRYAAGKVAELGRLLGGWIRQTLKVVAGQGGGSKGAAGVAGGGRSTTMIGTSAVRPVTGTTRTTVTTMWVFGWWRPTFFYAGNAGRE